MLYPLRFKPLYKQYMWGGRRFETSLGKKLAEGGNYAESWEVCDHGADQSVVAWGSLAGSSLSDIVAQHGRELFGQTLPSNPLPPDRKNTRCQANPFAPGSSQRRPGRKTKSARFRQVRSLDNYRGRAGQSALCRIETRH